ncbi:MAG TPA: hypothetical protein VMW73_14035 [Spirochaetia bacterium]|nr:hypothetical protein [Spirochaetia bacterium]
MAIVRDGLPRVLVPYPGPATEEHAQDIFVYLRPETNDVRVESAVLKVIEDCPAYRQKMNLVYLANLPGEFIIHHHIVEKHYALKLEFAVHGKHLFTTEMKRRFSRAFGVPFQEAQIIGSFEALRLLDLRPEELFEHWVPDTDLTIIDGQSVKRIRDYFIVNYDIPALLHKNSRGTDIAVMIFRVELGYTFFNELVEQMRDSLIDRNLLNPRTPPSRAFHYSKGPFEQILDGIGYLVTPDLSFASLDDLTFPTYLRRSGVDVQTIYGVVQHPIIEFGVDGSESVEENLFTYTQFDDYDTAVRKLNSMVSQVVLPRHAPEHTLAQI